MRLLLVSANTHAHPYPVYPLGLDYVAGAIGGRHAVRILDLNAEDGDQALTDVIDRFAPEAVAVSLRNIDNTDTTHPRGFLDKYRKLAGGIRARTRAPLILGGSGFTIFPDEVLRALGADYGIVGEGERLAALLDALAGGRDGASLPGIVTPHAPAVRPGPWPEGIIRRFDPSLPHVAYYLKHGGMLNLQTKRGCSFNCVYCTYPQIEGRTPRLFPPQEVAQTARQLQDAGARYLFVTDSVFNASESHSLAVAKAFRSAGVSIPWGAFFAPLSPCGDYFRTLADSGLAHVEFGSESLSDPVLKAYRKPFGAESVFAAHAAAAAAGLHVAHYLLLGGPGETLDTLAETLERVERLERCVLFFFCGMRIYPQTELYLIARQDGQAGPGLDLLEPVFYRAAGIDSREVTARVQEQAAGRPNWVIGDGGDQTGAIIARMHGRGHAGPLWEYLVR